MHNYLVFIDLVSRAVSIAVALYFIFVWVFGGSEYRVHSFILVLYSAIYYFMPALDQSSLTYKASYIQDINVSMLIEGAAGLVMVLFLSFDRLNKYHALILAFAVVCHIMVYCHYQKDPEWILAIAFGFHAFYDELIILVGILQMAVSYNGFITARIDAILKLQGFMQWSRVCYSNLRERLPSRKKGEAKT